MTGGDWLDDTGLVRLPSDALVRGRRLGDPASTADFGWSWPAGRRPLAAPAPPWPSSGGGCAASADPGTGRAAASTAAAHPDARCCWSRALSASVHRTGGTTAAQPLTKSIA
jgi:hypothetical protein